MATLTPLTNEQVRRVQSEIADCQGKINREMAYSKDLRNVVRIKELTAHIEKLKTMIHKGWNTTNFVYSK